MDYSNYYYNTIINVDFIKMNKWPHPIKEWYWYGKYIGLGLITASAIWFAIH